MFYCSPIVLSKQSTVDPTAPPSHHAIQLPCRSCGRVPCVPVIVPCSLQDLPPFTVALTVSAAPVAEIAVIRAPVEEARAPEPGCGLYTCVWYFRSPPSHLRCLIHSSRCHSAPDELLLPRISSVSLTDTLEPFARVVVVRLCLARRHCRHLYDRTTLR